MPRRPVNITKMERQLTGNESGKKGKASTSDWQGFIRRARATLDDVEMLPERAADFGFSVTQKIEDMVAWAEEHEHVTERMETSLSNMADGVARWGLGR